MDAKNPEGNFVYLENADETVGLTINSKDMDFRIKKGVYTIEGKLIVGYDSNDKPIYTCYEKVFEIHGTQNLYMRLPVNLDMSTVKITLGYDGLCASKNHNNVCSYDFKNLNTKCTDITLEMTGYTKIWLGYGVDAKISCNGTVVATGNG